jgi:hypothetical protein
VPKHAKSTKRGRNEAMMSGIRKYLSSLATIKIDGVTYTPAELVAVYQRHLDKLKEVAEKEAAWRAAVQDENALEQDIQKLTVKLNLYVGATFGPSAAKLLEFGIRPRGKPITSAETKRHAVEARRRTRKLRWTMGPKQRKKIKGA